MFRALRSWSLGHSSPGMPSDPLCRPWVNLVLKICNSVPGSGFQVNSLALSGLLTLIPVC